MASSGVAVERPFGRKGGVAGVSASVVRGILRFARRKPVGAAGAFVLIAMLLMALLAGYLAPFNPNASVSRPLQEPSWDNWFGTDHLGRDVFSRVLLGSRPSLYTGVIAVTISSLIGTAIGMTSAYIGGAFDLIVQRFVDAMQLFPALLLAMFLLAVFSSGFHIGGVVVPLVWHSVPVMVVIALSLITMPVKARVIRAATFGVMYSQYVEAAKASGCSDVRIIVRHILPNIFATIVVTASVALGGIILTEASLSFLGLGIPPPHPSWGSMLSTSGRRYMESAPWLGIFPGLAVSLSVLAFNLFGDALRDELDPRLRGATGRLR